MSTKTAIAKEESSPTRREVCPMQYLQERTWFESHYHRPQGVLDPCDTWEITSYQHLIWENPPNAFIKKYGHTAAEMALLCGQGNSGLLMSSHIEWLLEKANQKSTDTVCVCVPTMSNKYVEEVIISKQFLHRFIFVVNVGKDNDGNVFIASTKNLGNHWVLVVAELDSNTVYYCDSLGLKVPFSLLEYLSEFVKTPSLKRFSTILLHVPSTGDNCHSCTSMCRNYPFHSHEDICGIMAVILAIVAVLDYDLFSIFTNVRSHFQTFLHDPSKYEILLRRVLISWFVKGDLNVLTLKESNVLPESESFADHCYSLLRYPLKRKADTHPQPCTLTLKETNVVPKSSADHCSSFQWPFLKIKPDTGAQSHTLSSVSLVKSSELSNGNTSVYILSQSSSNVVVSESPQVLNVAADDSSHKKSVTTKSSIKPKAQQIECPICHLVMSKKNLTRHRLRQHKAIPFERRINFSYGHCAFCKCFRAAKVHDLITHYSECHDQKMEICEASFEDESAFYKWKMELEKDTHSRFIQTNSSTITTRGGVQNQVKYLKCYRSGVRKKLPEKRSRGTAKIGNKCPAHMIVRKDIINDSVSVEYCLNHIGHSDEFKHLPMSNEMRSNIAMKLSLGMDIGKILDEVKKEQMTGANKDHLITRKDIHNIRKQFKIALPTQKHKEIHDTLSSEHVKPMSYAFLNDTKTAEGTSQENLVMDGADDLGSFDTEIKLNTSENEADIKKLRTDFSNEISQLLDIGKNCDDVVGLQMIFSRAKELSAIASEMKKSYK